MPGSHHMPVIRGAEIGIGIQVSHVDRIVPGGGVDTPRQHVSAVSFDKLRADVGLLLDSDVRITCHDDRHEWPAKTGNRGVVRWL